MTPSETMLNDHRGGSGKMFDGIAHRYDLLNRLMSFGLDRRWRRKTVESLALGTISSNSAPRVLDLATGTADLAIRIARTQPHAHVTGLDPSSGMLEIAGQKTARFGLADRIDLVQGSAEELPFDDDSFDAVCIGFGIRNVPDRPRALREMARVVRPGGRIAILELSEPERGVMGKLAQWHVHVVVPRMGALLSGSKEYRYLQQSIAAFPRPDVFADIMRESGIYVLDVEKLAFGACQLFVGTPDQAMGL